jgi:hypothetical protein
VMMNDMMGYSSAKTVNLASKEGFIAFVSFPKKEKSKKRPETLL